MDLDGTLLTSEKCISPKTIEGLQRFADTGVHLILASGRTKKRMQDYADALDLASYKGKIIESNGSAIYDYETDVYEVLRRMTATEAAEMVTFLKRQQVEILVVGVENVFIMLLPGESESRYLCENSDMEGFRNRKFYYIQDLEEVPEEINKICVFDEVAVIDQIYESINTEAFEHEFWCGRTLPVWLEIGPASVSKGNALKQIMQTYDLEHDEVLVFGDGENDLSMMNVVKHSVAMGNAMDTVKQNSFFVCDTNDNDGIVKFLEIKEEIL